MIQRFLKVMGGASAGGKAQAKAFSFFFFFASLVVTSHENVGVKRLSFHMGKKNHYCTFMITLNCT
jgi:hypothetical protein